MNEEILKKHGFSQEVELVKSGKCPICSENIRIEEFKDSVSFKEFEISGMCQSCQDDIFED